MILEYLKMSNSYNLRKRKTNNVSVFIKENLNDNQYKKRRVIIDSDSESDIESDSSFNVDSNKSDSESDVNSNFEDELDSDNNTNSESNPDSDTFSESESDSDPYFKLDKTPLKVAITRRLHKILPNFDSSDLSECVGKALKKASDDIVGDYCTAEPNSDRWKLEVSEDEIDELEEQLKEIRKKIKDEIPTMAKILKARIPSHDKKLAVQLYDNLQNMEPYTYEYTEQIKRINTILQIENELKDVNIEKLEIEEEKLIQLCGNKDAELKNKILMLDADDDTKTRIYELYVQMQSKCTKDSDYDDLRNKLEWATNLPFRKRCMPEDRFKDKPMSEIDDYLYQVRQRLDFELYGMINVKERLIEILNDRIRNPKAGCSIIIHGQPGVGKTAVVSALARAIGVPFDRVSMGGLKDESLIKGSNNTYVGARPSIFIQIMKKIGVSDGIVQLDEIDKIESKGAQHSLLEPIDPSQNFSNKDHFITEFDHDYSRLWFIGTANNINKIDPTLRDRWECIELQPYPRNENIEIIKKFIIPKQLKKLNLNSNDITISDDACNSILNQLNSKIESEGLRPIESEIKRIISRLNLLNSRIREDGSISKMNLSYDIKNFTGFPYCITSDTFNKLKTNNDNSIDSWKNMYI